MTAERVVSRWDTRSVEIGSRAAALVVVLVLSMVTTTGADDPGPLIVLLVLAIVSSLPVADRRLRRWRPPLEIAVASALIAMSNPYDPALLPYLVVPCLSAGLIGGWTLTVTTTGISFLILLGRGMLSPDDMVDSGYAVDVSQWTLLALTIGLLGSWLRRLQAERSNESEKYAEAARLLGQLRDLSRELSGGLDAVGLAQVQLDLLRSTVPHDRGWVFTEGPGGLLVLLATNTPTSVEFEPEFTGKSIWAQTWRTHDPHRSNRGFTQDPTMASCVLPMRVDEQLIGMVGIERRGQLFSDLDVATAQQALDQGSVRIGAALLFSELRTLATTEERQRLAREIHDGIAQELASLGYVVDDMAAGVNDENPALSQALLGLRSELTRVISELRLSIFDLRREVGPGMSLGSALAEHVRVVGATSDLTVHLELAESPRRLRIDTETELLRIAQESIANTRRHAGARNLWVTCRVDPPNALLRIEDDGKGMSQGREDSFGIEIMKERAKRAGGTIVLAARPNGGTVVEVDVGHPLDSQKGEPRDVQRAARR